MTRRAPLRPQKPPESVRARRRQAAAAVAARWWCKFRQASSSRFTAKFLADGSQVDRFKFNVALRARHSVFAHF
ncbi:hypothetical protein C0Z16_20180 [Paraburkholderia rhynchosiae]|uniref:Uncharacterized protein n=1 Tax=Paraburkholderia rhynchosiae TaxID=487049 RepID=A0ABX4V1R5_9BURK|nr:hypothetical protein C0Z16_20180 [Paraburkholderia rhynchosiae]